MQLPLFQTGPLSAAVQPFVDPDAERPDAFAMIAQLVDLRGGVRLAEHLDDIWDARDAAPATGARVDPRPQISETLRIIRRRLDAAYDHPERLRYRLPTAARMRALADAARDRRRAARAVWAPFAEFLEVHFKRAHFALAELTADVRPQLLTLGGDAAALVGLDMALEEAMATRLAAVIRELAQAIEAQVNRSFKRLDLTDGAKIAAAVAPIFADGVAVYRALYLHLERTLTQCVAAALAAAAAA